MKTTSANCCLPVAAYRGASAPPPGGALGSDAGAAASSIVYIGPVDCIAPGQGRAFTIAGRTIAIFRQRDGRVFATDNQCPHRGGPLAEGIVGDGKVICPLHSWKIDLTSGQCLGESAQLRTYAVYVVDDRIWVRCPNATENRE